MLPMALVGWHTAVALCLLLILAALAAIAYLLAGPLLRRHGRFGVVLGACALALLEPVRGTFSFGQVNLLLPALVLVDAWLLSTGRGRWAGVGIGLAAAVKLTPAIFIGLLLLARRWRAAGLATAVAVAPPRRRPTSPRTRPASTGPRRCGTRAASAASTMSPTSRCRCPGPARGTARADPCRLGAATPSGR